MSTRTNVIVKGDYSKLWFYRHQDGYPSVTLRSLMQFMHKVASGEYRGSAGQSAGWLIIQGHKEYAPKALRDAKGQFRKKTDSDYDYNYLSNWKVGAYEPTNDRHGDIEYLYILNLCERAIYVYRTPFDFDGKYEVDKDGLKPSDKLIGVVRFERHESGRVDHHINGSTLKSEMQ